MIRGSARVPGAGLGGSLHGAAGFLAHFLSLLACTPPEAMPGGADPDASAAPTLPGSNLIPAGGPILDLGCVAGGRLLPFEFPLANPTSRPVSIRAAGDACSCTLLSLDPESIPPFGQARLSGRFRSPPRPGPFQIPIELFRPGREEVEIALMIRGEVCEEIRLLVHPRGIQLSEPSSAGASPSWGKIEVSLQGPDILTQEVRVTLSSGSWLRVVEASRLARSVEGESRTDLAFLVGIADGAPRGVLRERLLVESKGAAPIPVWVEGLVGPMSPIRGTSFYAGDLGAGVEVEFQLPLNEQSESIASWRFELESSWMRVHGSDGSILRIAARPDGPSRVFSEILWCVPPDGDRIPFRIEGRVR
jgi:hypothetical protein